MSLNPTATFAGFTTASATSFVNAPTTLDVRFTNPSPGATEAGYQPYVTVELPPGVTWNGTVSYNGAKVQATTVVIGAGGSTPYPFALSGGGTRPAITGTAGDTVIVAQLPFGSFVVDQTAVDLSIPVTLSASATPGSALAIKTTGGFAYGNSALGANGVAQSTASTYTITPTVVTISSVYNGPQGQAATGPTIQATYGGAVPASSESITVHSDIASGATVTNFGLTDALPNGAVPTEVLLTGISGAKWYYTVSPTTGAMTLDTTLTSAGDQATAPSITTAAAASGAVAPYVYYDAASAKVVANFGSVTGTSTSVGQNAGPSINTWFYEGPQQSLGHGSATAQAAGDLTVVDNLPYQAVAQSFNLYGPNGEVWKYTINGSGVVSFASGPAGAPAILSGAGASGSAWVYFDKAGGKIVANFTGLTAGQSASIDAGYSGGQAQPQPGVISTAIGAGNNASVGLVDQLSAGSQASGFTVTIGSNTYTYNIGAGGVITAGIGNGAGAPAASSFSYDSANSRIIANLTNVPGGAGGSVVTLAASNVSGGNLVSAGGQAVSELSYASATGVFSLPGGSSGSLSGVSASASVSVQDLTVQKAVTPENANVIPGSDLDYTITGQIGSLADIHNIVVSDTLGDGQYLDTGASPTLTINVGGITHVIGFGVGDAIVYPQDPVTGKTAVTFNVSQAMLDAGLGFSDFSVQGNNPATFAITFKSTVDTQYRANPTSANDPANYVADRATYAPWLTNANLSPRILSGDVINNALTTTGTLANGAVVSTGANASVKVPTATLAKSILLVDNSAPVLNAAGQINANTGSVITYELKEVLPVTNTSQVTLTDFLPLPVFSAAGFSFDSTYHATLGTQTGGVITWAPGDTFHTVNGAGPTISYDAAQNAVVMNFDGQANLASYATTTIDLLFNAVVQDAAFTQDLQLTNQVVGQETNSFNMVSTSQAIGQITLNAPELKIEKGAVATSNTTRAVISGTRGGVTWNAPGSVTPFTGTITTQALGGGSITGTSVLNSTISQLGAGDKVTFAIAVENLGADPKGAFNITLHDTLPSTLTLANVSNFRVVDGTGATLTYSGTVANFFSGTGITLTDPSSTHGALAAESLTSGKNVAVVLYDVTLPGNVATPDETITNTATIDSYTAAGGTVNRATVAPSGYNTASATITTDHPSITKSFISTGGGEAQTAVRIGDTVHYRYVVTLPGGSASGVKLSDVLPTGITLVSNSLSSLGGEITTSGPGVVAGTTTIDLGNVTVASNGRGVADQITVDVVGRVDPAGLGNISGAVLSNRARITETNPNGGAAITQTSNLVPVTLAEPILDISKTTPFISGDAGSVVTYTSVISVDPLSTGPAFNVTFSDPMAPGLLLVHGSESLTQGGVTIGSITETANGFVATLGTLALSDAPITVSYQAKLANTVADGSALTNTATLDYASLASNGRSYETSAAATVHAHLVDQFSKSLIGTSLGTPQGGPPPEVVPGETLTYTLTGTLDTGTQHLVLNDVLPAGLDYLSSKVISLGNTSGSALAVGAAGTFNAATNTVSFDFGAAGITNPAGSSDSKVVVQVTVKVDAASGFLNTLQTDTGHLITSTPTGAPGIGAGLNTTTLSDTKTVKIVPPGSISGIAFLDGNCTGTYHVGEAGVAGVTVKLYDNLGNFTGQTAITDNDGAYSFTPLTPGKYTVQFTAPQGTSFSYTEHASGNPLLDSDVNPTTGLSDVLTVTGGHDTPANAGLGFNDNFNGVTPIDLGSNGVDAYGTNGVYKGNGGAIYHIGGNAPGQTILTLHGQGVASTVEAGGGNGNDIVTSCGPINGQGQNAANLYMQAGPGGSSTLQGGSGNSTLIGSTGNDLISAGSGINVLTGGGNSGTVYAVGGKAYGFSAGDELRTGGISTTILFQKGDGVDSVDNGFRLGTDKLTVYGYSSAQVTYINSQAALYFGGNDLIYFNGASPFANGATLTNGSVAGVTFVPTLPGTPTSVLSFPSSGQPSIGPSSATPAVAAPVSPTPSIPAPSIPSGGGTVNLVWGQTYNFGDTGTYVVGFGDNHVTGGNGDNAMTVMGWNNVISFGDGNNKLFGPGDASKQGNTTISVGNGNNLIGLSGYHNMVTTGNGTNVVVLGDGDSTIDTKGGTDAVVLSGWNNLVIGGLGHDTVAGGLNTTYRINGLGGGMDIYNFAPTVSIGSTLDIHNVLAAAGYAGNPATLGSFVSVTAAGTDTLVKVAGSQVADLHNVSGVSLASLLANHNLLT